MGSSLGGGSVAVGLKLGVGGCGFASKENAGGARAVSFGLSIGLKGEAKGESTALAGWLLACGALANEKGCGADGFGAAGCEKAGAAVAEGEEKTNAGAGADSF